MNFTSKLTLVLAATATTIFPIAAYAGPSTGSTAAAVSIKFSDYKHGSTSGYSTIAPSGAVNAGGSGVKELSAAVATGETSAIATSASHGNGTTATANGFSQPVTFKYVHNQSTSNSVDAREYASHEKSQYNQQNQSASGEKQSNYSTAHTANSTNGHASNGTKGKGSSSNVTANSGGGSGSAGTGNSVTTSGGKKSSTYSASNNSSSGNADSTHGGNSDNRRSESGNSQNGSATSVTEKTNNALNTTAGVTTYEYTGTSAGLFYIPAIK
jgi:hypothetical protein